MTDFWYVVKVFALTIVIVLFMQLEIGNESLEYHAMSWVQNSAVTGPLHTVAHNAGVLTHNVAEWVSNIIHRHTGKKHKSDSSQNETFIKPAHR